MKKYTAGRGKKNPFWDILKTSRRKEEQAILFWQGDSYFGLPKDRLSYDTSKEEGKISAHTFKTFC